MVLVWVGMLVVVFLVVNFGIFGLGGEFWCFWFGW